MLEIDPCVSLRRPTLTRVRCGETIRLCGSTLKPMLSLKSPGCGSRSIARPRRLTRRFTTIRPRLMMTIHDGDWWITKSCVGSSALYTNMWLGRQPGAKISRPCAQNWQHCCLLPRPCGPTRRPGGQRLKTASKNSSDRKPQRAKSGRDWPQSARRSCDGETLFGSRLMKRPDVSRKSTAAIVAERCPSSGLVKLSLSVQ